MIDAGLSTEAGPHLAWKLACPFCAGPLIVVGHSRRCVNCDRDFHQSHGIWRFLPEERAAIYETFMREYRIVRTEEGWGGADASYYRALPSVPADDPHRQIWLIRRVSFRTLIQSVIRPEEARQGRSLMILDLGAGNCWLANRLAEAGHRVAAVDLSIDERDGLGALACYGQTAGQVVPIQAELDHLPFATGQADLAVFSASLHYSPDYAVTLREALRAVKFDGHAVIMDSPLYGDPTSGARMVREREVEFEGKYGFASNAIVGEGYLTRERLEELSSELDIDWQLLTPWRGFRWALRPWRARLRRHREPAAFPLIVGRRRALPSSRSD